MPKIKPLKIEEYSKFEYFYHDLELQTLIVKLYKKGVIVQAHEGYKVVYQDQTIYINCSRIHDTIEHDQPLKIINVSLWSWIGRWNSSTKNSHTMIDRCALHVLLKIIDSVI